MRQFIIAKYVALVGLTTIGLMTSSAGAQAAGNSESCAVDWPSRTAACPKQITQPRTQQFKLTGVNDIAIDFASGTTPQYVLTARGTPASQTPPADFAGLFLGGQAASAEKLARPPAASECQGIENDIKAVTDARIVIPATIGNRPASLDESMADAQRIMQMPLGAPLSRLQMRYLNPGCATALLPYKETTAVQWLSRFNSTDHSRQFNVNLNPNTNYHFELVEYWSGQKVNGSEIDWRCGETDILSLSVGPLVTTLAARTYSAVVVPTAPGADNTQSVLGVSESPGTHIGQFADYPSGFTKGAVIPSSSGTLNPVTRNTVHFAVGLTFKATSLKKSSQDSSSTNAGGTTPQPQTPTGGSGNQPSTIANPASPQPESGPPGTQSSTGTHPLPKAKWTALVYMNGKNSLEDAPLANAARWQRD